MPAWVDPNLEGPAVYFGLDRYLPKQQHLSTQLTFIDISSR